MLIQRVQDRLLKIVNKKKFIIEKNPLNIVQQFSFESLKFHYRDLQDNFVKSNSITRKKSILLPLRSKSVSAKNSYIKAIMLFNSLPNDLKNISSDNLRNSKLKKWVSSNA